MADSLSHSTARRKERPGRVTEELRTQQRPQKKEPKARAGSLSILPALHVIG